MQTQEIQEICHGAILWGAQSDRVFLYVHGKCGCKEEAKRFAYIAAAHRWQVLSIDLPEHGARKAEAGFDPWHVVPELHAVMAYLKENWQQIALCVNSIGAWFSLLAFAEEELEQCLMISPILDMEALIQTMMGWACVTQEELERRQEIVTEFGETLSWKYFLYARENRIVQWDTPTSILYAGKDHLTQRCVVEAFARRYRGELDVMEDGEHWFHTPQQCAVLERWMERRMERFD